MCLAKFIEDFEGAIDDVEPGSLFRDTLFKDLKSWDSLAVLMVTDVVEMEYGVLLTKKSFENITSLEELYILILSKK